MIDGCWWSLTTGTDNGHHFAATLRTVGCDDKMLNVQLHDAAGVLLIATAYCEYPTPTKRVEKKKEKEAKVVVGVVVVMVVG